MFFIAAFSMCDEFDALNTIIIPAGTTLFSGGSETTSKCPHAYQYRGQRKHVGKILYLTSQEGTAKDYAMCFTGKSGWVKKYITHADLELVNVTDGATHYEWDDVVECFCRKGGNGYYLDWGGNTEYALCNASAFLTFVEAKKCMGRQLFSDYMCAPKKRSRVVTRSQTKKKNKRNFFG